MRRYGDPNVDGARAFTAVETQRLVELRRLFAIDEQDLAAAEAAAASGGGSGGDGGDEQEDDDGAAAATRAQMIEERRRRLALEASKLKAAGGAAGLYARRASTGGYAQPGARGVGTGSGSSSSSRSGGVSVGTGMPRRASTGTGTMTDRQRDLIGSLRGSQAGGVDADGKPKRGSMFAACAGSSRGSGDQPECSIQ